jgi:lipid II:glycine glycyltransferase (peptidoglycan interpeptide bridge formation enzyme)
MGNRLTIYVARQQNLPIASVLTLTHEKTVVYKYGCSDERFHNLGGMPFLFWNVIQDGKATGLEELDLGRSDEANPGLVRFKDHLGAVKSRLSYWRYPQKPSSSRLGGTFQSAQLQKLISVLPDRLFRLAGEIIYRHAG